MSTNYDKIKQMNIDEMAEMFAEALTSSLLGVLLKLNLNIADNYIYKAYQEGINFYKKWLEEECKDEN